MKSNVELEIFLGKFKLIKSEIPVFKEMVTDTDRIILNEIKKNTITYREAFFVIAFCYHQLEYDEKFLHKQSELSPKIEEILSLQLVEEKTQTIAENILSFMYNFDITYHEFKQSLFYAYSKLLDEMNDQLIFND